MWKLNRMMECVRNIGRSDADPMRKHHLQDCGLRLKGRILKWRPTMTTGTTSSGFSSSSRSTIRTSPAFIARLTASNCSRGLISFVVVAEYATKARRSLSDVSHPP